ncbi:hypothetical protein H4R35_006530 [Dimargaris xerosporica]|nr:hypothetical protein H4R35_006530 [Dimargaris xerosporica]
MESTTFETPTIYDTRPTHTSKVRLARPKAESYELAAISASDRERMISQFTSDVSSGVDTDAFSIDTYDSDDDYFAEEEDDLVALNRAVDRIAEHSNQMQKRKLPRSDSATSVSPGGSQTMPSSSTFTRKPPGSSTPSAVSAQSFSATPSQDETATFTKGSLLHQLHQKQKSS